MKISLMKGESDPFHHLVQQVSLLIFIDDPKGLSSMSSYLLNGR
jgi:hypothetical protein